MAGAIWNFAKSLADAWQETPRQRYTRSRIEAFNQDRSYRKTEAVQLDDKPEPGRLPYAGFEPDDSH